MFFTTVCEYGVRALTHLAAFGGSGPVQVKDIAEADARALALADESVAKHMAGKEIRKVIFVPGRLINIVGGEAD